MTGVPENCLFSLCASCMTQRVSLCISNRRGNPHPTHHCQLSVLEGVKTALDQQEIGTALYGQEPGSGDVDTDGVPAEGKRRNQPPQTTRCMNKRATHLKCLMAAPIAVSSWMTGSPLGVTLSLTMISRSNSSLSSTRLIALHFMYKLLVLKICHGQGEGASVWRCCDAHTHGVRLTLNRVMFLNSSSWQTREKQQQRGINYEHYCTSGSRTHVVLGNLSDLEQTKATLVVDQSTSLDVGLGLVGDLHDVLGLGVNHLLQDVEVDGGTQVVDVGDEDVLLSGSDELVEQSRVAVENRGPMMSVTSRGLALLLHASTRRLTSRRP